MPTETIFKWWTCPFTKLFLYISLQVHGKLPTKSVRLLIWDAALECITMHGLFSLVVNHQTTEQIPQRLKTLNRFFTSLDAVLSYVQILLYINIIEAESFSRVKTDIRLYINVVTDTEGSATSSDIGKYLDGI